MKKKKNPIVLFLLLAALFGGIMFMNKPASATSDQPPTPEVKPEEKAAVGNDVASAMKGDKKDDKKDAKKADTKETDPIKSMVKMAHHNKPGDNAPSILKPQMGAPQKPKPNDSSISTQWYKDESAKSHDKGGN